MKPLFCHLWSMLTFQISLDFLYQTHQCDAENMQLCLSVGYVLHDLHLFSHLMKQVIDVAVKFEIVSCKASVTIWYKHVSHNRNGFPFICLSLWWTVLMQYYWDRPLTSARRRHENYFCHMTMSHFVTKVNYSLFQIFKMYAVDFLPNMRS